MTICEDAPCCGCCGTGVWGNNNPEPMDDYEYYGSDADGYFDYDDEDESDEDEGDYGNEDAGMEAGLWGGDC